MSQPRRSSRHGTPRVHRIRASGFVAAPPDAVSDRYRDVRTWPSLFPTTITAARTVARSPHRLLALVTHRQAGFVLNRLAWRSSRLVLLRESRSCFDAVFGNRFERSGDGTRYIVEAVVRFQGLCRVLGCLPAPWRAALVERRLQRFVVRPMQAAFDPTFASARSNHADA